MKTNKAKEKLENIIAGIGEKEFIKLIKILGYELTDKDKFYDREQSKSR